MRLLDNKKMNSGIKSLIAICMIITMAFCNIPDIPANAVTEDEINSYKKVIDVSAYNYEVDFKAVKDAGYTGVMIRIGAGQTYEDPYFSVNYDNAVAAGFDVGIYYYSYATNADEAKLEANRAIALLSGRSINYPIAIDMEEESVFDTGVDNCTAIVKTFCETVAEAGYDPAYYLSRNKVVENLDYSQLSSYKLWIANYECDYPDFPYPYWMWQYEVSSLPGANNQAGECDKDILYEDSFVEATSVTLDKTELGLQLGDGENLVHSDTITGTVNEGASNRHVNYKSENEAIATVDEDGNVTAVGNGEVNVIASSVNGVEAVCKVTVTTPATGIEMDEPDMVIGKGETVSPTATLTPADSTDHYYFKSDNEKIVKVNEDGSLVGVKKGEATITVTTDSGVTTTMTVEVKKAPWRIHGNPIFKKLAVGETYNLGIKIPKNSASHSIEFYSFDTEKVDVDQEGNITGKGAGWCLVKVTTYNDKRTWTIVKVE